MIQRARVRAQPHLDGSPLGTDTGMHDHIDEIAELWARERPELDLAAFQVVGRVLRLARYLQRDEERVATAYGVNATEYRILCALRRAGAPYSLSPGDLIASLLVTSGAVTKRIDRLEEFGYVERRFSQVDRRAQIVQLTRSGRRLVDKMIVADTTHETRSLSSLSLGEIDELAHLLRVLLTATEHDHGEADEGRG